MKETNMRSLTKAISWRLIATVITFCIALLFTGEIKVALGIGGLDMFLKLIAYFIHERAWEKIKMGRVLHPLSDVVLRPGVEKQAVLEKLKELEFINDGQ